jgi:hypothetical protein
MDDLTTRQFQRVEAARLASGKKKRVILPVPPATRPWAVRAAGAIGEAVMLAWPGLGWLMACAAAAVGAWACCEKYL